MKKVFGIAALLLALAACNKETEITPVEQPSDSKGITITATLAPKTADTKAVADNGDNKITVTWAENEHIAILYDKDGAQVADATITAVDGTTGAATISFTVVSGTADNTACTLVYPYSAAKDDKSGVKDAATLLSAQDGTLNANLDVRVGAGTIRTTTPGLDVTTQPAAQFAIFKFTLSGPSIDATHPLVIMDNASNKTITTVTPASTATSVFVAMPAAASTTYKFVVATADNKYIKSGTATIEAGKYYRTPLTMEPRYPLALSSATIDDLGAVVNSEGQMSVEKAAASGTAVGIVGKVTETGHGLILALQDAASQNWNTINGWTSVDTYAGTTLKVLPDDAARGTKLTSYTALGTTAVSNWAVAQKSDYEAIFQTLGSTAGDGDGTTYDGNVNAYITTGVGGAAISGDYWSATENDVDIAWDFFSDFWDYSEKEESYSVRPVLGFGGDAAPAYTLLSDATTSDYGKVVCDGGHLHEAKTAVPAGCTAVGILGKVTSTGHGLILALKDATSQDWNTINGWTSETSYAGITLKVLPDDAARGTNLTSYTALGSTAVSNWAVAQKSDYEAIFINLGSIKSDEDGYTYDANVNAYITTGVGGTALSGEYWSATEYDGDAWYFCSVFWDYSDKEESISVRPVLGF